MTAQIRTSYLPSEILWAHRLAPLLAFQNHNGQYRIDYRRFHAVEPVSMPDCSANTLTEFGRSRGEADKDEQNTANLLSCRQRSCWNGFGGRSWSLGAASVTARRVRANLRLRRQRSRRIEHVVVVGDVTSGVGAKPEVDGRHTAPRSDHNSNDIGGIVA